MSTLLQLPLIATNPENSAYTYLSLVEYDSNIDDDLVSALKTAAVEEAMEAAPSLSEDATKLNITIWQVRAQSMLYSDTSSHYFPTIRWTTIFGRVLRIRLRRN